MCAKKRSFFRQITVAAAIVVGCAFTSGVAAAEDSDIALLDRSAKAFSSVVKKAGPAVVHVRVEKTIKGMGGPSGTDPLDMFRDPFFDHFFGPQFREQPRQRRQFKERGAGSGFIISPDGYILTNNHVVDNGDSITVRLSDEREFEAKIIGTDARSDVALIKIEGQDLPTLPLGNSDKLEVGEWVIAIGSPFALSQSVTVGVVSAKGRNRVGISDYENFIQTDAAINPGNSGGPLLNIHGEAVGMNTAIFSRSGGYMGIGFAIPINMAKSIQQQLQDKGKVIRGWLGVVIQDVTEDLAASFDLKSGEGVLISEVTKDSPAEKSGLLQGDVVLSINNVPVKDVPDLRNRIAMTLPDTSLELGIVRNGKNKKLQVTVGEQPASFAGLSMSGGDSTFEDLGLHLQDLTDELAAQMGYKTDQGVLIADVVPGSLADLAGLQRGQLIEAVSKKRVRNINELQIVLKNSKSSNRLLLLIRDGEFSRYVVLRKK